MLQSLIDSNLIGVYFILRWLHVFAGLIWIGLLYYFNYVQGPYMAEADAGAKSQTLQKLVPRALWWFRYAALWTWVLGVVMLMIRSHQDTSVNGMAALQSSYWVNILTGSLMGTLMFLNVWGIIWRKQKIVIQNAVQTATGGVAIPEAAAAGARALVASRTNTLLSVPMLFFMLGASHLGYPVTETSNLMGYWIATFVVVGGIELNAIYGKTGPLTTIKGVITCGFLLTALFVLLGTVLI